MNDDRRRNSGLSEDQFHRLKNEIKAEILIDIYAEIGRSVVAKILWTIGAVFAALLAYLGFTGKITIK